MKECVICKFRYQKGSGVTFHKFPSDKVKLDSWLQNIEKPGWHPKKYDCICSKHFSDDCFIKHASRTALKTDSIPTMFCSSCADVRVKTEITSYDPLLSINRMEETSHLESSLSTHTKMVSLTPSVSGKIEESKPITEMNDTKLGCVRVKSEITNYDPLSIDSQGDMSNLGSSPSTHSRMVSPTLSVSGRSMATPTLSVSGRREKSRLLIDKNDAELGCVRIKTEITSYDPLLSIDRMEETSHLESSLSTHTKMVSLTPSVSGKIEKSKPITEINDTKLGCVYVKSEITNYDPLSIDYQGDMSNLGSSPLTHARTVSPTLSVSGTRMATPTLSVSGKREKSRLLMEENDTELGFVRVKTEITNYDPLSIDCQEEMSNLGSSPSTHAEMVSPIRFASGTRIVTPTLFASGKIEKSRLNMEQNDTKLDRRRRRSNSCDLQPSFPFKKVRSHIGRYDIIQHDHHYASSTQSSNRALQRTKQSLKESRARVKVLTQQVQRLKAKVSRLCTIISELKKKNYG